PTIIRSRVDFPHPDGPTRMTNSPSAMSRLTPLTAVKPSGYVFTTLSRVIDAMGTPSIRCGPQPLTAPWVRPETMRRWKSRTTTTTGTVTTMAAAEMDPVGSSNCEAPVKKDSAAGTGRAALVEVSEMP